jgi:hypothetical protein
VFSPRPGIHHRFRSRDAGQPLGLGRRRKRLPAGLLEAQGEFLAAVWAPARASSCGSSASRTRWLHPRPEWPWRCWGASKAASPSRRPTSPGSTPAAEDDSARVPPAGADRRCRRVTAGAAARRGTPSSCAAVCAGCTSTPAGPGGLPGSRGILDPAGGRRTVRCRRRRGLPSSRSARRRPPEPALRAAAHDARPGLPQLPRQAAALSGAETRHLESQIALCEPCADRAARLRRRPSPPSGPRSRCRPATSSGSCPARSTGCGARPRSCGSGRR